MLALIVVALTAGLLLAVAMPLVLWTLSMETLRDRAAFEAAPTSSARLRLVRSNPRFDTLMSVAG